jgi:FtsH-binding integral membrane protein
MPKAQEAKTSYDRQENGAGLMIIGLALIVVDLLFVFFVPAAFKTNHPQGMLVLIAFLALVGLWLVARGRSVRKRAMKS